MKIDAKMLSQAIELLNILNHQLRQEIIQLLSQKQKITVTDIYILLRSDRRIISQHLALLRKTNVVVMEQIGRFHYYSLNIERLEYIMKVIKKFNQPTVVV